MERVIKLMTIALLAGVLLFAGVLNGPTAKVMNVNAGETVSVSAVRAVAVFPADDAEKLNEQLLNDIEDLGLFRVLAVHGLTAKQMFSYYGAKVIIDKEAKTILLLFIEA